MHGVGSDGSVTESLTWRFVCVQALGGFICTDAVLLTYPRGMTDVRHREQQDEKVLAQVSAGPSIDDAKAQALLDKHMSRWSTLLDRLK